MIINRFKNEHWAVPTDTRLSFFGEKHHHHNHQHQNDSQVHQAAPQLFLVTFPSVYNVLSFLEAKDILTSFYPTCRGFAQIVQSLSTSWWYDRLFDIIFPSPPSDSFSHSSTSRSQKNVSSSFSFHEMQQENLRSNALHYLHRMVQDRHLAASSSSTPPVRPLKQRIAQMCHYYQQKFPGCPTCHFPGENNFVVKNFRMQVVTGDELKTSFIEPWCAKQAVVEAFFLRGDSAKKKNENQMDDDDCDDSNILEGLAFPFSWQFLTADVNNHRESQNCAANHGNSSSDTPRFLSACASCNNQYQIHPSDYENADPAEFILGPIRRLQQENIAANKNQNDDGDDETTKKTRYPPLRPLAKLRTELSLNILSGQSKNILPSVITIGHEAEYWALLRGSTPTKVMTYVFRGERKHCVLSRLTNPITLKSVELRSFFGYRIDSFPRFFCQITFYAEGMIFPSKLSKKIGANQTEEVVAVKTKNGESSSSSDDDDSSAPPSTSSSRSSSSSSSSSDDDEAEMEESQENIKPTELEINSLQSNNHHPRSTSTATTQSKTTKRKKKAKHHEILLTGSYATPKKKPNAGIAAVVSNDNSQDTIIRIIDPCPPIKDRMEAAFNSDSELVQELFFAGYGRVEVEKVPALQAKQLQRIAEYLELSPDFPLPLLWNAIILSTGFVVDYLIYADDMRMTHRVALENMFEEALVD